MQLFSADATIFFLKLRKTRLKTSFRPKPRDQILFSKVNYRRKVRFKTANFGLYEIEKEIASFLGKFKPDEMCCNET